MAHTEKPLSFIKVIDRREKLNQFDPSFESNRTFKEFWKEYKEKLGAISLQAGNPSAPRGSSCGRRDGGRAE
jgi:hypothetical protein